MGTTATSPTGTPIAGATPTSTSSQQGFITSGTDAGQNALQKQLNDIYGAGVGDSLFSLLNSMSGTNSTVLQEYIASLQPQMATTQANTNAALGAGGVGANSSVAAIADSALQGQEFASIAGESANLTQSQEQLTSSILSGMEGAASKEVATSGWSTFGNVMGDISSDIGAVIPGASGHAATNTSGGGIPSSFSSGASPAFASAVADPTAGMSPGGAIDTSGLTSGQVDLSAFSTGDPSVSGPIPFL
jgi:hypothetical protein